MELEVVPIVTPCIGEMEAAELAGQRGPIGSPLLKCRFHEPWISIIPPLLTNASARFNNNKGLMFQSCSQFGQADDSGPEVGAIWNSIESVAQSTGVDHRFILAVIMQESGGCVRAPTTNYGVRNPGLMQDHNGSGTCNSDLTGLVQNPCPSSEIQQMIADGTGGTNDGDGLAQCINQSGWGTDADFYRAARLYNSGSIASSGQLQDGIATHCYASDIANRLTGWVWASHGCYLDG